MCYIMESHKFYATKYNKPLINLVEEAYQDEVSNSTMLTSSVANSFIFYLFVCGFLTTLSIAQII
jgi:hypothetical protein